MCNVHDQLVRVTWNELSNVTVPQTVAGNDRHVAAGLIVTLNLR